MRNQPQAGQRRIVVEVSNRMALREALETQLAASRATAVNLRFALVDIEEIRERLGEASDLLFPAEKRSQCAVISCPQV